MSTRRHLALAHGFRSVPLPYGLSVHAVHEALSNVYEANAAIEHVLGEHQLQHLQASKATFSSLLSDQLAAALAEVSDGHLVVNGRTRGVPRLLPPGMYDGDSTGCGAEGIDVRVSTRKTIDFPSATGRPGWYLLFWFAKDPITGHQTYCKAIHAAQLEASDFNRYENENGHAGHMSNVSASGRAKLQAGTLYVADHSGARAA